MVEPARPRFFDGQYIGADDLDAIGDYAAARQREHVLAAHGWGIACGLDLTETAQPDGSAEVSVQPGYGWDGYGRAMAVRAAIPLPLDQLRGLPSGAWFVWLSYRETGGDLARASYGVCEGTDLYQRVMEGCALRVTGDLRPDERESGLAYGGATRADARLARRVFDPEGPVVCDGAIPEQGAPPLGARSFWLIPLGLVGWDAETQRLRPLADPERQASRLMRRYVATVAESVMAPDGLIRLRDRNAYPLSADPAAADLACARHALTAADLAAKAGRIRPQELVWVEGAVRAYGDMRLFGAALELRDGLGGAPQGPMAVRRRASAAVGAQDLEIAIGAASGAGVGNRLLVGPVEDPAAPASRVKPVLAVRADGRVGVGTDAPALTLDVAGDFGHEASPVAVHLMGSRVRDAGDGRLSLTSGGGVIVLGEQGHRVGVNVKDPAPDVALDLNGGLQVRSSPAFARLLGSEIRDGGDGVLRVRSGGGTVAFDGADKVAIGGDKAADDLALDVRGGIGSTGAPAFVRLLGSQLRDENDGRLRIRSGGDVVTFDGGDRVGVGTIDPQYPLDVVGQAMIRGDLEVMGEVNDWGFPSDARLKRDVRPIEGALETMLGLRGVRFQWKDAVARGPGDKMGFIADQVETVLPEWVRTDPEGVKRIRPSGFEALAVEAVRTLLRRTEALEAEIERLKSVGGAPAQKPRSRRADPKSPPSPKSKPSRRTAR